MAKGCASELAKLYENLTDREFPGGPDNAVLHRTYAGYWQRLAGAWSWWIVTQDSGLGVVASCSPAKEVLRAARKGLVVIYRFHDTPEFIVELRREYV